MEIKSESEKELKKADSKIIDEKSEVTINKESSGKQIQELEKEMKKNMTIKTDVYFYGIVLFALFTGRLPKQNMKDHLGKVPLILHKPSSKISEYCINLIKMHIIYIF